MLEATNRGDVVDCEIAIARKADVKEWEVFRTAILKECLDIILLLLDKGAEINNNGNSDGATPLTYAAAKNKKRVCEYLLYRGALVDGTNKRG